MKQFLQDSLTTILIEKVDRILTSCPHLFVFTYCKIGHLK